MARRWHVRAMLIGLVTVVTLGAAWWAFGQYGPATNPPALSPGFDRPLVRDVILVHEVADLTQRVDALEAAVKDLQARLNKGK